MNKELNIKEIYSTLQGEGPSTGRPATFVRLAGCSLRCHYCDSEYAFEGGEIKNFSTLIADIQQHGNELVVVTGGEPLDQESLPDFLIQLISHNFEVELETAGHKDLSVVPSGVRVLLDIKTPGSGMSQHFKKENLALLDENDILKFVITHREDFDWSAKYLNQLSAPLKATVWFSPCSSTDSHVGLEPAQLAEWILTKKLPVRLQLQQHKIIWDNEISR